MRWKNPGVTYFGSGGGGGSSTPKSFTSSLEELAGQTFNTEEEMKTAEQQAQANTATSQVQTQVEEVSSDPQSAYTSAQNNIVNLQTQIDQLKDQAAENPALQAQVDTLVTQLQGEQAKATQAQSLINNQMNEQQRQVAQSAVTNPADLVQKAQVATTPLDPSQEIQQNVGQASDTGQATTSTVEQTATAETPARQGAETVDVSKVGDQTEAITEDLQAAVAQPSDRATVRGQLAALMQDFEGGETPPWASGAMRQAMSIMQARGMGASSVAGAAIVQAAMESAISIASQDANTTAQFEMASLTNEQQTRIFKTQQRLSGLFSDQAAENAARQFNASSKNQVNQFFANLEATASQFNSAQINAIRQFNSGQENAIEQFNAQLKQQREQFNAQNSLVIAQANAQWRQQIATADTAAKNVANLEYTKNINAITGAMLDQIWQRERDIMDYAFTASESELDRANSVLLAKLSGQQTKDSLKLQQKAETQAAFGSFLANVAGGLMGIL